MSVAISIALKCKDEVIEVDCSIYPDWFTYVTYGFTSGSKLLYRFAVAYNMLSKQQFHN